MFGGRAPAVGAAVSVFSVRRGVQIYVPSGGGGSGSAVPFSPVIQNAVANGSGSVTIYWYELPAGTYTSLDIYWSATDDAGLSGTKVNVSNLSAQSHTFTITAGTRYFWMSLSNSAGESDPSARRTLVVT